MSSARETIVGRYTGSGATHTLKIDFKDASLIRFTRADGTAEALWEESMGDDALLKTAYTVGAAANVTRSLITSDGVTVSNSTVTIKDATLIADGKKVIYEIQRGSVQ